MGHKRHCKKPLNLRVVSKNMLFGYDVGERLDSETTPSFDPPLPSFFDIFERGIAGEVIPEVEVARMYENMWQQCSNPALVETRSRLTAMARELAAANADVIALQECSIISNNPLLYADGSPNLNPYELNNGIYGTEASPANLSQTFNFAEMLIQRLRDNHGQEFVILSQTMEDGSQGKRTLNELEDAEAIVSFWITNATLVRKKLGAKLKGRRSQRFFYTPDGLPIKMGRNNNLEDTVEIGFGFGLVRAFESMDVKICGVHLRLINIHLQSGSQFDSLFTTDEWKLIDHAPAGRSSQVLQLLREEVIPSPYPAVILGDLNTESLTKCGFPLGFPLTPYQTLVGSVDGAGNATNSGGYMVDAAIAVHGAAADQGQYNTASPRPGSDWVALRDPNAVFRFRIDHIMYRDGDGVTAKTFELTQPVPFPGGGTGADQWAWTSDHIGIVSDLCIPRKH